MITTRRSRTIPLVLSVLAAVSMTSARPAHAQPRFEWPEKPKNLKVLPKDIGKDSLRTTMVGFTRALGVRCSFCHVGQEGQPLTTYDFPSDMNPMKKIARKMVKMVRDVKSDLKGIKFPEHERVDFGCVTCHRGRPRPLTLAEELTIVYEKSGIDSTAAAYKSLRGRFYGRGAYDFGEESLNAFGRSLLARGRQEDAFAIFRLNVEQNPTAGAYVGLGDAYMAAGQTDMAVQNYKKALELDPMNHEAEQKLRQSSGGSK